jgi:hypothetical protein
LGVFIKKIKSGNAVFEKEADLSGAPEPGQGENSQKLSSSS